MTRLLTLPPSLPSPSPSPPPPPPPESLSHACFSDRSVTAAAAAAAQLPAEVPSVFFLRVQRVLFFSL